MGQGTCGSRRTLVVKDRRFVVKCSSELMEAQWNIGFVWCMAFYGGQRSETRGVKVAAGLTINRRKHGRIRMRNSTNTMFPSLPFFRALRMSDAAKQTPTAPAAAAARRPQRRAQRQPPYGGEGGRVGASERDSLNPKQSGRVDSGRGWGQCTSGI